MSTSDILLAIDLGAESGRAVTGRFDGKRLQLEEVLRFPNQPVQVGDTLYWDVLSIHANVEAAIAKARAGGVVRSVGIDAWGVDFGLLDRRGQLIGNPVHYRDRRTAGVMERAFEIVPREAIFNATGNMFLELNTLYQLLSLRLAEDPALDIAARMLNTPDLLHYWLSGEMAHELTIASTTQCMTPDRKGWAWDLLRRLEIPTHLFGDIVAPGTCLGTLRGHEETKVIAPASHDTGSAVMAVPARGPGIAWISSGTWSVVGVLTDAPVVTPEVSALNFTNESAWGGQNRLSRNVMGLWILQECRREWAAGGETLSYDELVTLARDVPEPLRSLIDPDDPRFFRPGAMASTIQEYCAETGQPVPRSPGEIARCVFESLALAYRKALQCVGRLANTSGGAEPALSLPKGFQPANGHRACPEPAEGMQSCATQTIHVVGGGSRNALLCQFTADAARRPVVAGPAEATAVGNLLAQAHGLGMIGSQDEMIEVVRRSFSCECFSPGDGEAWEQAFGRFQALGCRPAK